MGLFGKIFRWIFYLLSFFVFLVLLVVAILAFVNIPVDLTRYKNIIETAATDTLNRKVTIDGKIVVSTSLNPSFSIQDVRIGNPEGFLEGDFIAVKSAQIQLGILPLLKRKIHLREISAKGLAVTLLADEKGINNWSTPAPEKASPPPEKKERERVVEVAGLSSDSLVIDRLVLEDIGLSFSTADKQNVFSFMIHECRGSAQPGSPTVLALKGLLQNHPFTSQINISSLQELIDQDRSWMDISLEIAQTSFDLAGVVDLVKVLHAVHLKVEIRGEKLDSLNELLQVELPPLQAYAASADLTLRQKLLNLNKLQIRVGDSSLEGNMVVDAQGERPDIRISMTAPLIQINDFDLDDHSVEKPQAEEKAESGSQKDDLDHTEQPDTLDAEDDDGLIGMLSQDIFKQFNAAVTIQLQKVLSGEDFLGGGEMTVTLREGRFSLDPLQLELPGGALFYSMSLEPGEETARASLKIIAENFDFGVAARRAKPDTDMGGTLNLDIDLQSSGGSIAEILANGSGYVDFSARPVNLNAGIMDLWVVNLLAAIITRSDDKGSVINCMISRWSMQDGVLTPDAFAVDTTKMRICGSGKIDMKDNIINLQIAPTPKRQEFFSLATPFSISGKIEDIKLGIASGGLLGTSIRFVASPVTTPLSWFLGQKIPVDGSDICSLPIGPDNRPEKTLPGCRR